MKIRVIYNKYQIVSADIPEGAAALDYDSFSMIINEHDYILQLLSKEGYDVSKISELLISSGIEITNPEWIPKIDV